MSMEKRKIEIMDTTLRDGEQTSGVSFAVQEKVSIARLLLEELKVDRVEVGSARVSEGEYKSVRKVAQWVNRGYIDKVEVLGFIDGTASVDWIIVRAASNGALQRIASAQNNFGKRPNNI